MYEILILVVVKIILFSATPAPTCPDDWLDSDHGCFYFANEVGSMTWNEATEYCESQNAYLAEVLTYETQTFLEFHGTSLPATNWWVGATDQTTVSTIVFPIS